MSIIQDGAGSGKSAKVNASNELLVRATSVTGQQKRSLEGAGYNINTGEIALTDGNEHAVLYGKYTGTTKFHIESLAIGVGKASGTVSNPGKITLVRNPTSGTIVSGATAVDMNQNRNFGSSTALSGNFYKGGQSNTFTDGDDIAIFYQNANGRLFAGIDFILEPGDSVGVNIQLNATNGANVYAAFIGHEEDADT